MEMVLVVAQIAPAKSSSRWVHSQTQVRNKIRIIFPGTVSVEGAEMAATARSRRSRRSSDDIAHRAERAQALVLMGDLVWPSSVGRCGSGTGHGRHVECSDRQGSPTGPTSEGVVTGDNGVHAGGAVELG